MSNTENKSASFCVNKYMRMAIIENIKKECPRYTEKLIEQITEESMKHIAKEPMKIWSRAIELAAIEKPRGNVCHYEENISDLGFKTYTSNCGHEYRTIGNAEFCGACGRRIEIINDKTYEEKRINILRAQENTDIPLRLLHFKDAEKRL